MNVLLFALGHQARQAHQEDVPHASQKTLNAFLCRDPLEPAAEIRAALVPSEGEICIPITAPM